MDQSTRVVRFCARAHSNGSGRTELTSKSNPGLNPATPEVNWLQTYVPIDTFPLPKGGLNDETTYCQRFRWTRYGLEGIDFGGQDIGRRRYGLEDNPSCTQ